MTATNGELIYRFNPLWGYSTGPSFTTYDLNSATRAVANILVAQDTATVTELGFTFGANVGTPPTYIAALESLDSAGQPSGTILGGGSPASATFTTVGAELKWVTLDNTYLLTRGDRFAQTIRHSSGADGSNYSRPSYGINNYFGQSLPRGYTKDTSTWTAQLTRAPVMAWRDASRTYGFPRTAENEITEATAGDRIALKFALDSGYGSTYQIRGIHVAGTFFHTLSGTCIVGIWDAAGTALQTITVNYDGHNATNHHMQYAWPTLATLSYGTTYYVGVECVSGTTVKVHYWDAPLADFDAFPGGTSAHLANWTSSAWVDDTDRLGPLVELVLEDQTVAAGGGADSVLGQVNMRGGML